MTNENTIHLPKFKKKVSKKARKLNLPVKNWLMYGVKILDIESIKPTHPKINGKKSTKYPIPVYLTSIDKIDLEKIKQLKENNTQEHLNYTNIDNFGKDKNCFWQLAPTHYEILSMWLIENGIGIGKEFFFTRIGKGLNSRLIFLTKSQMESYMKKYKIPKDENKKETKK